MLRESLRTVVNSHAPLHVIAEASNGVEAIDAVRAFHPDVVVMDINMPRMNGIEAARVIKREFPDVGIVGLSIHDSGEMVERMSDAGISAYVTKEAAVKTLCHAIEEAAARRV
jgi:DNA-binding NarL/FixJ family response regulator